MNMGSNKIPQNIHLVMKDFRKLQKPSLDKKSKVYPNSNVFANHFMLCSFMFLMLEFH